MGQESEVVMRGKHQKRKGLFRKGELIALGVMISFVLILFAVTGSFAVIKNTFFPQHNLATFKTGQSVQIISDDKTNKLEKYKNWIGEITSITAKQTNKKYLYTYRITFDNGKVLKAVKAKFLKNAPKAAYSKNTLIQIASNAETDSDGYSLVEFRGKVAHIDKVHPNYANNDGGYLYDVSLKEDGRTITNITESALASLYQIALKQDNSASQNNEALRQAFDYARAHPETILAFPSGKFDIGSSNPEKDYQQLPSDTQLYGNETKLNIQGRIYWLGFATGAGATEGVKNFSMSYIDFIADNLTEGNQFMIMANHGDNWQIKHNSFTMVQKKGSHIFDLGGLQNSIFDSNQFIGYAPELTEISEIPSGSDLHDYYAEAIQIDASDNSGIWDGGILQQVDANYSQNNPSKQLSSNITISNNSFLPYSDSAGNIIAYSASIGQHSSEVGEITVYGNTFTSSLVSRYPEAQTEWVMKPIHFPEISASKIVSYDNITN